MQQFAAERPFCKSCQGGQHKDAARETAAMEATTGMAEPQPRRRSPPLPPALWQQLDLKPGMQRPLWLHPSPITALRLPGEPSQCKPACLGATTHSSGAQGLSRRSRCQEPYGRLHGQAAAAPHRRCFLSRPSSEEFVHTAQTSRPNQQEPAQPRQVARCFGAPGEPNVAGTRGASPSSTIRKSYAVLDLQVSAVIKQQASSRGVAQPCRQTQSRPKLLRTRNGTGA